MDTYQANQLLGILFLPYIMCDQINLYYYKKRTTYDTGVNGCINFFHKPGE